MLPFLRSRSEFFRNVITMMSGTVMAQLIPVALSPVLSRIYSPDEFGIFSLFSSIAAAVAVIATFRYELAIMLPEKEETAVNVLRIAFIITISLTILSSLTILLFNDQIPQWVRTPELKGLLYYIPLFLLFAGGTQALNYWISRQKNFRLLAAGKVGQTGSAGIVSIVLGLLNFSTLGLVLGAVAGQFTSFMIFTGRSIKKLLQMEPHVSRGQLRDSFKRYKTFMYVNTPHALLGTVQDLIVILLLNYFFSKTVIGWYAFGFRILKVPAAFIGAAVYQVYFQRASAIRKDRKQLRALTKKVYLQMIVTGLPVFIFLALMAPQLFSWIFGKEWFEAGRIAQILSPWLFLNFIVSPVAALSIVLNKQTWAIWFTVADILLRSTAIVIGGIYRNEYLAFLLLSAGSGSLLLYALYWLYQLPLKKKNMEYEL